MTRQDGSSQGANALRTIAAAHEIHHAGLLVRPRRVRGESERGYVLRVAARNGLRDLRWLELPGARRPSGRLRVCPLCLDASDACWLEDWEHRHTYWCSAHRVWLADQCPICGRPLNWATARFGECRCGGQLATIACAPVDDVTNRALASGSVNVSVLRWLGSFALHGSCGKAVKRTSRRQVSEVRDQLREGALMWSGWPGTFEAALTKHRRLPDAAGIAQRLDEAFPRLSAMLMLIPDEVWRQRVWAAVDRYCEVARGSTLPLIGRNSCLASGPPSVGEIAARLRVRVETVINAVDSAKAPSRGTRVTMAGRRRRVLSEEDVAALGEALSDGTSLKAAARQLALPARRVQAMVDAGLLTRTGGVMSRRQIERLGLYLRQRAGADNSTQDLLDLREALRRWVAGGDTAAFMTSVLSGVVWSESAGHEYRIGSWRVVEDDVRRWSRGLRDDESGAMALGVAARQLGIKGEVASELVRGGHLPAKSSVVGGRRRWSVTQDDLEAFRHRFVPLVVLARQAGVRPRDAFVWATSRGLSLATGPQVDGSRQYFVDRRRAMPSDDASLTEARYR